MAEVFSNGAQTTLAAHCGAGDLTVTVQDGSAFPATGTFRVRIDAEILKATAVAGNVWTVARAAEAYAGNQAAASHAAGAQVSEVLTAGGLKAVALDEWAAPSNVTTLDVSIAAHGLCPKLPNDATKYLDGTGHYTAPAGGGGSPGGSDKQVQFNDATAFGGDAGFVFDKATKQVTVAANAFNFYAHLCDVNYAGQFWQNPYLVNLAASSYAGYFSDGTRIVFVANGTDAIALPSGGNISTDTTTGTKIGTAASQLLALWGATPVAQPATTGTTGGHTIVGGNGVSEADTFDGALGGAAYTVGDVVLALKRAGILAS